MKYKLINIPVIDSFLICMTIEIKVKINKDSFLDSF